MWRFEVMTHPRAGEILTTVSEGIIFSRCQPQRLSGERDESDASRLHGNLKKRARLRPGARHFELNQERPFQVCGAGLGEQAARLPGGILSVVGVWHWFCQTTKCM